MHDCLALPMACMSHKLQRGWLCIAGMKSMQDIEVFKLGPNVATADWGELLCQSEEPSFCLCLKVSSQMGRH